LKSFPSTRAPADFENQEIDFTTLCLLDESNLEELGLPLGPRVLIARSIRERLSAEAESLSVSALAIAEVQASHDDDEPDNEAASHSHSEPAQEIEVYANGHNSESPYPDTGAEPSIAAPVPVYDSLPAIHSADSDLSAAASAIAQFLGQTAPPLPSATAGGDAVASLFGNYSSAAAPIAAAAFSSSVDASQSLFSSAFTQQQSPQLEQPQQQLQQQQQQPINGSFDYFASNAVQYPFASYAAAAPSPASGQHLAGSGPYSASQFAAPVVPSAAPGAFVQNAGLGAGSNAGMYPMIGMGSMPTLPDALLCPIGRVPMVNAVTAADGVTYEKQV
jgi:hypothetical protein